MVLMATRRQMNLLNVDKTMLYECLKLQVIAGSSD